MKTLMRLSWMLAAVLATTTFACGGGDGNGGDSAGSDGGNGDGDGGGGNGTDGGGGGGGGDEACRHLDIVISVDASSSMNEEMTAMAEEVFGGPNGFANALLGIADGLDDYRVGTLDACPDPASFHEIGEGPTDNPDDDVNCQFASGKPWIEATPSDNADEVIAEFECVGRIDRTINNSDHGITAGNCEGNSDDERPVESIITSLNEPFLSGDNAGFLREDAVLVMVAITDEDEQPIPNQTAQQLYDNLVAIKGDVNHMVFLGIGGGAGGCSSQDGAYGGADHAQKIEQLSNLFIAQDRGVFFDLCQGNLGDGLSQAIEVIQQACEDFNPVD